ncbi:MAG: acyl carrier protein [Acidobacteria bacterium]|nr:MAG: acyl carrier protein [Acidobacteriota bacterium]
MGKERALQNGRIREEVARILREEIQVEVPSEDCDLIESGLLDSLTFVDLLAHVERVFRVSIDIASLDLDDLRSVDSIARFIESQRADQ